MADLFVSYSREDKARAAEVVRLLEDYGWDVFWDQETRAGELWPKVLEEELGKARCLVALWTTTSIASRWVRIEAYEALQGEKLVPVLLDKVRPPLEFRQTQTFDLTGWNGDREDARLAHLLADLTALAKAPSSRGASRRPHIVVPTTLRRDMPAATLPDAVSAASGEPDAQPATIVPRLPADHGAASSSPFSLSRIGSSRGVMLGLGVTAAVAAIAWLINTVDFTPEPTQSTEPTKSLQAVPAAPSTSAAAPASAPAQSPSAVPPPATTTTTVAADTLPAPQISKPAAKQPPQKLRPPRCLAIEEKFQQTGQITVTERDLLRSKECQ
jgi:TIR domain